MKRKVVNIGIFAGRICTGGAILNADAKLIYKKLRDVGFVETRWQLIFDSQVGGLVYPYNEGLNEIHIRFYTDRIFAELEFSRSSIFHFLFPLYNANSYIVELLKNKIPASSYRYLIEKTVSDLRDDESSKPHWEYRANHDPYLAVRGRNSGKIWFFLHRAFGWRKLVSAVACFSLFLIPGLPQFPAFIVLLALFSMRFVPDVGKP
jgi:hypothetical protein